MVKITLKNGKSLFLKEDQVKKIKGSRLTTVEGREYEIQMTEDEIEKVLVKVEKTEKDEDIKKKESLVSEASSLKEAEDYFVKEKERKLICIKDDKAQECKSLKVARKFYE